MKGMHGGGSTGLSGEAIGDPSLLLMPGHPLSLTVPGEDRRYKGVVLGVKPGEFLIIRPPSTLPAMARRSGAPLLVRLEEEGTVVGFETTVLSGLKLPLPVLFLTSPRDVEVHVLRRHFRHKCLVPTVVEAGDATFPGHLCDVSLGGCRVVARASDASRSLPACGEPLDVRLPVEGLRFEKLAGRIRRRVTQDGAVHLGISFEDPEGAMPIVSRFLEHLQLADGLREPAGSSLPPNAAALAPATDLRDATARVGDALQVTLECLKPLDIQFTGSHLYERTTILGVDGTRMAIAEMPLRAGLRNCPKPGMGLRGRFEAHGSHYGFMTSVMKFITQPRPMVLFAYPKKIEILMRRKHPRVTCLLPARLENEHCRSSGYVTDISLGGCRVLANLDSGEPIVNVMTGDRMDVSLPLDGLKIERIGAKVNSLRFEGQAVAIGLAFALDRKQTGRVARFMDRMETASR